MKIINRFIAWWDDLSKPVPITDKQLDLNLIGCFNALIGILALIGGATLVLEENNAFGFPVIGVALAVFIMPLFYTRNLHG